MEGMVCMSCGRLAAVPSSAADERQALSELHDAFTKTDDLVKRADLIRNAFLPSDTEVLLEAAIRCQALLNTDQLGTGVPEAAESRIRAILSKLELEPGTDQTKRAVATFESVLVDFDKRAEQVRRRERILGWGCAVVFLGIGTAVVMWLAFFL